MNEEEKLDCLDKLDSIIDTEFSNIIVSSRFRTNVKVACNRKEKKTINIFLSNAGFITILVIIFIITSVSAAILKSNNNHTSTTATQSVQQAVVTDIPTPTQQMIVSQETQSPTERTKITKEEAINISYEKNKKDYSGIPAKYAEPIKNAELKYYTKHPAINVNSDKYVWVVDIKYYNPDYNPPEVWGGFQDIVDAQTGEILNHDTFGGILAYPY